MAGSTLRVWSFIECKDLDDDGLSALGSVLPPGFTPPCDFTHAKPKTGNQSQQDDCILLVEQLVAACEGSVWDKPTVLAVRGWWDSHNNAKAVEWAAALYSIPVAASKSSMINDLIAFQALPIAWRQLEYMSQLWDAMSETDQEVLSNSAKPALPLRRLGSVQPEHGSGSESPPARSGGGSSWLPPDVPEPAAAVNAVDVMSNAFVAMCDRMNGKQDAESKIPEDAVEKVKEKARRALSENRFFDIRALSEKNLYKLRFRGSAGPASTLSFSNGVITAVDQEDKDVLNSWDWHDFQSAWNEYIVIMVSMPDQMALVSDRMKWFQELSNYRNVSDHARVKYGTLFMHRHMGATEWLPLFYSDASLLLQYMPTHSAPSHVSLGDAHARGRTRGKGGGGKGAGAKRQRSRSPVRGKGGSSSPRQPPHKRHKYCFSRTDRAKGECAHGNGCRFDHRCASCGGPHSAAACPNWDQAVVDRNLH
jgi:hypothetical protein